MSRCGGPDQISSDKAVAVGTTRAQSAQGRHKNGYSDVSLVLAIPVSS
jgi:hypothetical protein